MKVLKVKRYYSLRNEFQCSIEMCMRISFIDRLKFLIHGDKCIFSFEDEMILPKRIKEFARFRKWREEYERGTRECLR